MTRIYVQKFGGSSLATPERLQECAEITHRRMEGGDQVVVVVSAMGSTTEQLISLARSLGIGHDSSSHDLLLASGEQISAAAMSLALSRYGHDSVPLSGGAAGLVTDGRPGCSEVVEINPERVNHELSHGRIPVVMGFQGMSRQGTLTLLGRGGSDTTAVVLAGALQTHLNSPRCEIYTDVDGVHTSDPKLVPHTSLLASIGYKPMHTLSRLGAQVMASTAVHYADCLQVPVRVCNSRTPGNGTMIEPQYDSFAPQGIIACAVTEELSRIQLDLPQASPALISDFLHATSESELVFHQREYNESEDSTRLEYTASPLVIDDLASTITHELTRTPSETVKMTIERSLARIAVVGNDLTRHSSTLNRSRKYLGSVGIGTKAWSLVDDTHCTFFVRSEDAHEALRATHRSLDLESTPQ
ncbi:MAG: hypothetical protein CBC35_01550 [Planctomycetes bacterium TMED75]|nr:hypothetical protein [Planctomycetaceae bacterium]OUU96244.1 MAG: hypothetical protein CBC35_01550 [Planctomycetes bacterium TMED75]